MKSEAVNMGGSMILVPSELETLGGCRRREVHGIYGQEEGPRAESFMTLHDHISRTVTSGVVPQYTNFQIRGHDFWWCSPGVGDLDGVLALGDHSPVCATREMREAVVAALEVLATRPQDFYVVSSFVTHFIQLHYEGNGSPITSLSLPDFPGAAFLTPIARQHIVPLTILPRPSSVFLAENIYHEAIHQVTNAIILTQGILTPQYSSAASPRISVDWRRRGDGTSESWEIDRVLHAAMVYHFVLRWRQRRLLTGVVSEDERSALEEANAIGKKCLSFLLESIVAHPLLTPKGQALVGFLKAQQNA